MKIQRKMGKGRGIRAILCGLLSVLCIAICGMNVYAGYTNENHPKVQFTPDGKHWTLIEELPYYEDYNVIIDWNKGQLRDDFSFWIEEGTTVDTGIDLNLPNPGVGQHEYHYERHGYVPVHEWVVEWEKGRCIHTYWGNTFGNFSGFESTNHCYCAYWSGLIPYCADCAGPVWDKYHYISLQSASEIQYINVDRSYFYICPHTQNHTLTKLEQGDTTYKHECRGVSYNQYIVKYMPNDNEANGTMVPSWHMYNDEKEYRGTPVEPQTTLSLNRYELEGYEFAGWNTKPDGSGTFYENGATIKNLTDENYEPDDPSNGDKGIVTLYANIL